MWIIHHRYSLCFFYFYVNPGWVNNYVLKHYKIILWKESLTSAFLKTGFSVHIAVCFYFILMIKLHVIMYIRLISSSLVVRIIYANGASREDICKMLINRHGQKVFLHLLSSICALSDEYIVLYNLFLINVHIRVTDSCCNKVSQSQCRTFKSL